MSTEREKAIKAYRAAQKMSMDAEAESKKAFQLYTRVKQLYDLTEYQIKAIQSYGLEVADVIRQLTPETCFPLFLS